MKKLLLLPLLSLAACSPTDSNTTHAAVTAYLRQHANDPASYEAVRWSGAVGYTRRDSASVAAEKLSSEYDRTASEGGTAQRAGPGIAGGQYTKSPAPEGARGFYIRGRG